MEIEEQDRASVSKFLQKSGCLEIKKTHLGKNNVYCIKYLLGGQGEAGVTLNIYYRYVGVFCDNDIILPS